MRSKERLRMLYSTERPRILLCIVFASLEADPSSLVSGLCYTRKSADRRFFVVMISS